MEYTKGEWKALNYKGGWIVEAKQDGYQKVVAMINAHSKEVEANAHLIAQSPRMAALILKVSKQGYSFFPEDRRVARKIIIEVEGK